MPKKTFLLIFCLNKKYPAIIDNITLKLIIAWVYPILGLIDIAYCMQKEFIKSKNAKINTIKKYLLS